MTIHKISQGFDPTTNEPTPYVQLVADDDDIAAIAERAAELNVPIEVVKRNHMGLNLTWIEYNVDACNGHDLFHAVWGVEPASDLGIDELRHLMTLCTCEYDVSHYAVS